MCLHVEPWSPVPSETARVVHAVFPEGHPYLTLRDTFPQLFTDADFRDLFPARGQPAVSPGRLALVTLLQFAEDLSDREAAHAVRTRLDWKYLLALELTDPGFDASVLAEFRERLLTHGAERRLFEHLLGQFRDQGWIQARGKQRTDSTHVVAAVRNLNRLELVGETLRLVLQELATLAPAWLQAHLQPAWARRYGHRCEVYRLPDTAAGREALAQQIGEDGYTILAAAGAPGAPAVVRASAAVAVLWQIWMQQFTRQATETGVRCVWRAPADLPPAALAIQSPFDPDARYSQKRGTAWLGYKWHATETCDPDTPHLIVDVQTTPAPQPDTEALPVIHASLAAHERLPGKHCVDTGYTEAEALVTSRRQYGVELIGPVEVDSAWQARARTGCAVADFEVDWAARHVVCPAGQRSAGWKETEKAGHAVIRVHFAEATCAGCPRRAQCTRSPKVGRRLTLRPEAEHTALQRVRAQQATAEFAREYAVRAGIEGTHSQAVRVCGLRVCRYVGEAKVRLEHLLVGAALNLLRGAAWLSDTPRARTRQQAFLRLFLPAEAPC